MKNTRTKERIVGTRGDCHIVERYTETEYRFVCPNCPGTPGMVAINGIKAEALQALWNRAKTQGLGALHSLMKMYLTVADCEDLLREQTYFDYLHGRVMKVDLSGDEFDPTLYDRDNGPGAAERAVMEIRWPVIGAPDRNYYYNIWATEDPGLLSCPRCKR